MSSMVPLQLSLYFAFPFSSLSLENQFLQYSVSLQVYLLIFALITFTFLGAGVECEGSLEREQTVMRSWLWSVHLDPKIYNALSHHLPIFGTITLRKIEMIDWKLFDHVLSRVEAQIGVWHSEWVAFALSLFPNTTDEQNGWFRSGWLKLAGVPKKQ